MGYAEMAHYHIRPRTSSLPRLENVKYVYSHRASVLVRCHALSSLNDLAVVVWIKSRLSPNKDGLQVMRVVIYAGALHALYMPNCPCITLYMVGQVAVTHRYHLRSAGSYQTHSAPSPATGS